MADWRVRLKLTTHFDCLFFLESGLRLGVLPSENLFANEGSGYDAAD